MLIRITIEEIIAYLCGDKKLATGFVWDTIGPVSEQPKYRTTNGVTIMLQLTDTQQCELVVKAVNKKGNPAPVQHAVWSSSDSAIATVTADTADPLKATVVAVASGSVVVKIDADADMGDGVTPISATLDVTVTAGQATGFGIESGIPEEQP